MALEAIAGVMAIAALLAGAIWRYGYSGKPRKKEPTLDDRLLLYLCEMKRHREAGTLTIQKRKELLDKYLPRRDKLERGQLPKRRK